MGADYATIGDMVDNLIDQCLTNEVGALVAAWLDVWKDENEEYLELEFNQDDRNAMLKALTGCVVGTGTSLNCYPTGYNTALLYDLDGEPIP